MRSYMPFDRVNYHGQKFPELRTKMGEVVAHVKSSDKYVVDFGLEDSYLVSPNSLSPWIPPKDSQGKEIEVQVHRKRRVSIDE